MCLDEGSVILSAMEAAVAQCPLINTARLQPFRQRLNRFYMTITETGYVCLELIGHMTRQEANQVEITKKLFRISPDGRQVEVYYNAEGMSSIDRCLASCQHDQVYTYPNMPDKLWKKYQRAHKFVDVIKSRTAKVILITDRVRCKLMENSPNADFQVCFPNGVTLVLSKLKVTLTDQDGSVITFSEEMAGSHVSPNTLRLLEYSQQCRDQCLKIEKSVSDLQPGSTGQDLFPITIGTSNRPFLLSSQSTFSPARPNQASNEADYHPTDTWVAMSNQGNILPRLNNDCTEAKTCKQPEYSAALHDGRQSMNVHQCNVRECQSKNKCSYVNNNSYDEKILHIPSATPDYRNSPQVPKLYNTLHPEVENCDFDSGNSTQSEDFSSNRSSSSSLKNHLTLATPQKSNNGANCSFQSNCSTSEQHLHPQSADVIEENTPKKTVYCKIDDQLLVQHGISGQIQDAGFVYKFESECNIPQQANSSSSYSACNCIQCTNTENTDARRPTFSPICQTNLCDNIYSQQPHTACDTNVPDSTSNQFLNNFVTPQKSSVPFGSYPYFCNGNNLKHRHHKQSERYHLPAEGDDKALQNVRRNLFSDQTSEELRPSPLPTYQANISKQDFLELSDCNSNGDSPSPNILQTDLTQNNFRITLKPQEWTSHLDSGSFQPILPEVESGVTMVTLSSPVKAPNIIKSVVKYPECHSTPIKAQTRTLAFPLYLDASVIKNSTQNDNLSISFPNDEHSYQSSVINHLSSENHFPNSSVPFTQQVTQRSVPEINTSPSKSAPVRKIASLSPVKMSSKMLSENSIPKNPTIEDSEIMSNDFFPYGHQTTPIKYSGSNSSSNASLSNSTANYNAIKSRENPVVNCEPGTLKAALTSSLAFSSCKEFPAMSREAGKWSGLDLSLSRHVRNSLDVSSDGHSSPPSSASDVICQVFVPYTGWALFYATGTVWILYNDGTQLGVTSAEASMIYIDQDGSRKRYTNSDVVPDIVKLKLEKLPKVIDMLMKSQAASSLGTLPQ